MDPFWTLWNVAVGQIMKALTTTLSSHPDFVPHLAPNYQNPDFSSEETPKPVAFQINSCRLLYDTVTKLVMAICLTGCLDSGFPKKGLMTVHKPSQVYPCTGELCNGSGPLAKGGFGTVVCWSYNR